LGVVQRIRKKKYNNWKYIRL